MKCIKRGDGSVVRVSDEKARREVSENGAKYAPKSEWKEQGRKRD